MYTTILIDLRYCESFVLAPTLPSATPLVMSYIKKRGRTRACHSQWYLVGAREAFIKKSRGNFSRKISRELSRKPSAQGRGARGEGRGRSA